MSKPDGAVPNGLTLLKSRLEETGKIDELVKLVEEIDVAQDSDYSVEFN